MDESIIEVYVENSSLHRIGDNIDVERFHKREEPRKLWQKLIRIKPYYCTRFRGVITEIKDNETVLVKRFNT